MVLNGNVSANLLTIQPFETILTLLDMEGS